jgi:hypothetical protein
VKSEVKAATLVLLLLAAAGGGIFAQSSRADVKIFIPRPESRPRIYAQQDFFAEQFKMEISAAMYTVTDNQAEADYLIMLTIDDNPYWGEPGEKQYSLTLALVRASDRSEVVRFSWPFTDMTEMYQWNLYLVYQAMANVPFVKQVDDPTKTIIEREVSRTASKDDRWRNKWLYIKLVGGADLTYFLRPGGMTTDRGMVMPTLIFGAELHFLPVLSFELDARARFLHDGAQYLITPSADALLKCVFKMSDYIMLEPFGGAEYSIEPLNGSAIPWLSVLAGVQFGFRAGTHGAVVLDFDVTYNLLGKHMLQNDRTEYNTVKFGLAVGYKFGFFDRKNMD